MGGRREVSIIFYRPVTRSDLKRERSFFRGSVSSFLQLVEAFSREFVKKVWKRVKKKLSCNNSIRNGCLEHGLAQLVSAWPSVR